MAAIAFGGCLRVAVVFASAVREAASPVASAPVGVGHPFGVWRGSR